MTTKIAKRLAEFKRLASLNIEENNVWIELFNYHIFEEGMTELKADRLAWQELVKRFPRLKKYKGAKK